MASETDIANGALTLLGASKITSIDSATEQNAIICTVFFDNSRDALIRKYQPRFATKRTSLTAHVTAPTFGRARAFDLPADYLAMLPPYPEDNLEALDWIREGAQILTDDASPLLIRYTAQITTTTLFDILFVKMLEAYLAMEMCEKITQSNSKYDRVKDIFLMAEEACRRANAFESVNPLPPEDSWVNARHGHTDNTKTWHG